MHCIETGHIFLEDCYILLKNGDILLEDCHIFLENGDILLEDDYIRLESGYVLADFDQLDLDVPDRVVEHPHAPEKRDKSGRDCPLEESNLAGEPAELVDVIEIEHDGGRGRLGGHPFRHRVATPGNRLSRILRRFIITAMRPESLLL
ncbi:MAG: hypothetical protein OXD35_02565 [Thiotrichales bacterium]|nr:hypothetical protein [Thiotrichales bacterium]